MIDDLQLLFCSATVLFVGSTVDLEVFCKK